jgi:hypothetical protein
LAAMAWLGVASFAAGAARSLPRLSRRLV